MEREIKRHLEHIVKEIGPRPTGSSSNRKAEKYLAEQMESYGLEVEREAFSCLDWQLGEVFLRIGGREVPVRAADYTRGGEVRAPLQCCGSREELEELEVGDRVLFLYGELTREPLMPKNFPFWNPREHQELLALLEARAPRAIISLSCSPGVLLPLIEDGDFPLPCAVVGQDQERFFLEQEGQPVHLKIEARTSPSRGANVMASRPGKGPVLALTAHLDTRPGTPGALDNGTGLALLLALASQLGRRKGQLPLELIALNGEDYYTNPGQVLLAETRLGEAGHYGLAVNFDGIAYREGPTGFSFYQCSDNFQARVQHLAEPYPGLVKMQPWPQGDHMIFVNRGLGALALTSQRIFELQPGIIHSPGDVLELVDPQKIARAASFILDLIEDLDRERGGKVAGA